MQSYIQSVTHSKGGGPAVGVSVRVNVRGTSTLAVLYSDNGVTPMANPTVTDDLGTFKFYAANGRYDIILSGSALKQPAIIADVNLYDPVDAPLPLNPAYKKTTGSQYLSGRTRDLSDFPFEAIYANGVYYAAATIKSQYPNGIPGVFERVADTSLIAGSATAVPEEDQRVWASTVLPTHVVTGGHPRNQIWGYALKQRTHYRIVSTLRPKHLSPYGWNDISEGKELPYGPIFVLSQQGGGGVEFSEGQVGAASSPLYIMMDGTYIYPELRVITEESGLAPDDPGGTPTHAKWAEGDMERFCMRKRPGRVLDSNLHHEIIIEVFLDDRRRKDGGQGYIRAYFDGEPWFSHEGPTSLPPNAAGNYVAVQPRWGLYEITGASQADGTLCSTVSATSVERTLNWKIMSVLEVTQ